MIYETHIVSYTAAHICYLYIGARMRVLYNKHQV